MTSYAAEARTRPRRWPTRAHTAFLSAVALVRTAIITACADVENSTNPRAVLAAEVQRFREQTEVLSEVVRILGARITVLPPKQRPHDPPHERAAILALAARTGWNHRKTADTFLLTAATIANWMRVVDVKGPDALVKPRKPINRFPAFVTAVVHQLSGLAPRIGKRQLAAIVARAGISISASTVGRMRKRPPTTKTPPPAKRARTSRPADASRVVNAKRPHHLWHIDVTVVPTLAGFWVPWVPHSVPLRWPFCWHVVTVLDHFSRAVVQSAVFRKGPRLPRCVRFWIAQCALPGARRGISSVTRVFSSRGRTGRGVCVTASNRGLGPLENTEALPSLNASTGHSRMRPCASSWCRWHSRACRPRWMRTWAGTTATART